MAQLILSLDTEILAEYKMEKERFTIGRLPGNDVRIDHPSVSGHHALIINILQDSFLEDLRSTNGTYVNGSKVRKHALQHGDLITCGLHQLRYLDGAPHPEQKSGFATTIVIPTSTLPPLDLPTASSAAATPAEAHATLHILSGPSAGRQLPLSKSVTTLGRPDTQVAAINRHGNRYYLTHVETMADHPQPAVNDTPIGSQAYLLNDQDVITVAGIKMAFFSS
jgi:predicted component of type VI protein secretion system